MSLAPGEKLGQYEIERLLGTGGMGQVYLARDTGLDRYVALKTLLSAYIENEAIVKRFEVEARAVAKFKHPNIVQVYQVDVTGPIPYIAMEYIEGQPLDQIIKEHGPLKWQHALNVCAQVAAALGAAHGQGIIHRDIKPANILVDTKWGVHVTDFGIAKVLDQTQALTVTDTALGSPSYMSPEHCGVGDVLPASDLFSLGVTLYESITGELPFKAENALVVMHKIVNDPHAPLFDKVEDLPPIVPMIVDTQMENKQDGRYSTAKQVLEDLRSFRDGDQPPHITMLRKKIEGRETTHYEIAEISSDILGTAKEQALVSGLLEGVETKIQPPVVRATPTRPPRDFTPIWTNALLGIAVLAVILLIGIGVYAMGNRRGEEASREERPTAPMIIFQEEHDDDDDDDDDDDHRRPRQNTAVLYQQMAGQRGYTPRGQRIHDDTYYNPNTLEMYQIDKIIELGLPNPPKFLPGFEHLEQNIGPGSGTPPPGGPRPGGPGPGGNRLPPPR